MPKITAISTQVRNPDRVNVSIDGKYRFSLDVFQLTDLGIKVGLEVSETDLHELEDESSFGKLYARALEYTMLRPHSAREIRDYLWRKTRATKYKSRRTGEIKERDGVSQAIAGRVFDRLQLKGYIDDAKFTRYWMDNRHQAKGISRRKLIAELHAKGIENSIIESTFEASERNDVDELRKVIAKKRSKYTDERKLIAYLARQGFAYDTIKHALSECDT